MFGRDIRHPEALPAFQCWQAQSLTCRANLPTAQACLTEALAAAVATLGRAALEGGAPGLLPALLAGVAARLDSPDTLVR